MECQACRQRKVAKWTAMEQGKVRIKWAHEVKYIARAGAQPLMVMVLCQSHAGGLVRLFSELVGVASLNRPSAT